jgi:hypothetical protein
LVPRVRSMERPGVAMRVAIVAGRCAGATTFGAGSAAPFGRSRSRRRVACGKPA